MAGLSMRFKKAGYELPKYMLTAHGQTLFYYSVASFKQYFTSQSFLFICLDVFDTSSFIREECQKLGIIRYQIVTLDNPTKGQAETVYFGLERADVPPNEPIIIFNIDTFRPNFSFPESFDFREVGGYLETFIGSGKNWSNIVPASSNSNRVALTAEKQEISQYCCTGLYAWKNSELFTSTFMYYKERFDSNTENELFVAPMYNRVIELGEDIRFSVVKSEDVVFCGIPEEYNIFLQSPIPSSLLIN